MTKAVIWIRVDVRADALQLKELMMKRSRRDVPSQSVEVATLIGNIET